MFKLSVKHSKVNDKLEKKIHDLKEYIKFLENNNKTRIGLARCTGDKGDCADDK